MKYVFMNCNVIDGRKECTVDPDKMIFVKDGVIESVCDLEEGEQKLAEDRKNDETEQYEMIDLDGSYVMPGLINMHSHLFGTGKPSKTLGKGKAQDLLLKYMNTSAGLKTLVKMVRTGVTQALNSGVTTIRGVGDFRYTDVIVRDMVNSGQIPGPRMIVSGPAITCPKGHGDGSFAVTANLPSRFREQVRLHDEHNVDLIKICVTGGVMDATRRGEPGQVKMTPEETFAACDEAHKLGYMVASHTESPEGIRQDLECGVDTVEHGSFLDDELIALFKEKNAKLICTISPAIAQAKLGYKETKLNEMCQYNAGVVTDGIIKCAKACVENGIPVGLGTDAACPFTTQYDMWRELYYFCTLVGVSNSFAIYSATLQNAIILGIDDVTGSVENGKCADLIVTKGNPLEDITVLRNVEKVVYRGNIIDEPKVKRYKNVDKALDPLIMR
jgi:imidazolonepropionase-like amidohydrolase